VSADPGRTSHGPESGRGPWSVSGARLLIAATAASLALVAVYLAAGGGAYEPTPVRDPCLPREWRSPDDLDQVAQQFTLSALDGAACELDVSRERLALALSTEESRAAFAAEHDISEDELEAAIRAGLERAIDDADAAGALPPFAATPLRELARQLPVEEAIRLIYGAGDVLALGAGLPERLGDLLPG